MRTRAFTDGGALRPKPGWDGMGRSGGLPSSCRKPFQDLSPDRLYFAKMGEVFLEFAIQIHRRCRIKLGPQDHVPQMNRMREDGVVPQFLERRFRIVVIHFLLLKPEAIVPRKRLSGCGGKKLVPVDPGGDSLAIVMLLDPQDVGEASDVHITCQGNLLRQGEQDFNGAARLKMRIRQEVNPAETYVTRLRWFFRGHAVIRIPHLRGKGQVEAAGGTALVCDVSHFAPEEQPRISSTLALHPRERNRFSSCDLPRDDGVSVLHVSKSRGPEAFRPHPFAPWLTSIAALATMVPMATPLVFPGRERRQTPRVRLQMPVRLRWLGPLGTVVEISETLDVSRAGLLVHASECGREDVRAWVTFPYDSEAAFAQPEIAARVVRVKTTSTGGYLMALRLEPPGKARPLKALEERRRSPRVILAMPIRIRAEETPWPEESMTLNLSAGGALTETTRIHSPGNRVRVALPSGLMAAAGELPACIVRIQPVPGQAEQRMALAWKDSARQS